MAQQTLFSFFKRKQDNTKEGAAPSPRQQQLQEAPRPAAAVMQNKTNKNDDSTISRSGSLTESLAVREAKTTDGSMQVDQDVNDEPLVTSRSGRRQKRVSYLESDDDNSENEMLKSPSDPNRRMGHKPRKRRLIRKIDSDDDEDGDYIPTEDPSKEDEDEEMHVADAASDEDIALTSPQVNRNVPSSPLKMTPLQERFKQFTVQSPPRKPSSSLTLTTRDEQRRERNQKFKEKNETRYSWLTDIRDENGNRIGTPEYDPRTLYIPKSAWSSFTAFEHQFWTVKSKYWDTVVFFKKGKFYELYEKDADIGHQEFDLKMTDRVNMRMVGVPESTFDYWAAQFIAKGHKVVRVDQMENAIGKSMRERNESTKADKVIRREVTAVYTAGTLVDAGLLTSDMSTYCMSIKEYCPTEISAPQFGICFTDTATSEFNLVSFEDDTNRTKFETLILQIRPRELVVEKGRLSQKSMRILKNCLNDPLWNHMVPDVEYWDHQRTEDEIKINDYFGENTSDLATWPEALRASADNKLLMSALGGLISYLRKLKLDKDLLSAGNIRFYDPIRNTTSLVLDGQTLANLEIFQNSYDGSSTGTLFELLNHCVTPFGKRLFKQWLCHPLRDASDINMRLDAVENLMENFELHELLTKELGKLPDLERLISSIHSKRCKVKEFLLTLEGFEKVKDVLDKLKDAKDSLQADLLKTLVANFPDIGPQLDFFKNAFITAEVEIDYQKMKTIIPKQGVNEKWDALNQQIADAETNFEKHLAHLKKELKCSRLAYRDLGKEIYQIEVPKEVRVPRDWIQLSTTSKVSRFWDATVRKMVTEYKELLEHKNAMVKSFTSDVYNDFDQHYKMWLSAVQSVAKIDALMSLAKASASLGGPSCRPKFSDQEASMIKLEELRHPCVVPGVATDFIPNDTYLGGENPSIMVLTGPNMGGKSTLLRQTCISIIMAQLGCYVPARSCILTPCDRIYTRIGANDNIMAGQSTFMVELQETSKILHEATPRSMVILDELGRGTSTYDGYAIAYAVLHYLATHVGCLAMFSTHYHTLCREFERNPTIRNMHMAYYMDEEEHNVTFLYKLTDGICEKSFGMNVAKMASVPDAVVSKATRIAEQFESEHRIKDTSFTTAMDIDRDEETRVSPAVASDLAYLLNHADDAGGDIHAIRRILKGFQYLCAAE